jgi:hypothetical protein
LLLLFITSGYISTSPNTTSPWYTTDLYIFFCLGPFKSQKNQVFGNFINK